MATRPISLAAHRTRIRARWLRRPIQTMTFLRKEAVEVLRQPRLLLMMVLGPLLVMTAFGLGYDDSPPPLRAVFVAPEGSPFFADLQKYADNLGSAVRLVGTTTDPAVADRMLADGTADVEVTFPSDPLETVLSGQQAVVTVRHTRLDPIERTTIDIATAVAVDQINGEILARIVAAGQEAAVPSADAIANADTTVSALDAAATSGDPAAWKAAVAQFDTSIDEMAVSLATSSVVSRELGPSDGAGTLGAAVADLRGLGSHLDGNQPPGPDTQAQLAALHTVLGTVHERFGAVTTVDANILVHPLRGEASLAVKGVDNVTDWYAPAAVILMLQQFGIAFGALSFVRERQLGIHDVLRVAPVGAAETVIGKYLAYLLIGGGLGAALVALLVTVLDVPLAGSIGEIAIVLTLVLAASIGVGLVISLASRTDAQAVQYTMIVLLASLFFSGFFLSIGRMRGVAGWIPWAIPATYGMQMLRDVMLRGANLDRDLLLGIGGFAVGMFLLALLGARRRLATAR